MFCRCSELNVLELYKRFFTFFSPLARPSTHEFKRYSISFAYVRARFTISWHKAAVFGFYFASTLHVVPITSAHTVNVPFRIILSFLFSLVFFPCFYFSFLLDVQITAEVNLMMDLIADSCLTTLTKSYMRIHFTLSYSLNVHKTKNILLMMSDPISFCENKMQNVYSSVIEMVFDFNGWTFVRLKA